MESDGNIIPNVLMFAVVAVIFFGVVLGFGENRKIVVYENYDDLALTFAVPSLAWASLICIGMGKDGFFYTLLGYALILGCLYVLGLTIWRTFQANERSIWKTALATVTKFPLAFLWVKLILELLNPSGKSGLERAKNRASALMLLAFLTPIISALVVEKSGHFSPRQMLKGKRIGTIRNHL